MSRSSGCKSPLWLHSMDGGRTTGSDELPLGLEEEVGQQETQQAQGGYYVNRHALDGLLVGRRVHLCDGRRRGRRALNSG